MTRARHPALSLARRRFTDGVASGFLVDQGETPTSFERHGAGIPRIVCLTGRDHRKPRQPTRRVALGRGSSVQLHLPEYRRSLHRDGYCFLPAKAPAFQIHTYNHGFAVLDRHGHFRNNGALECGTCTATSTAPARPAAHNATASNLCFIYIGAPLELFLVMMRRFSPARRRCAGIGEPRFTPQKSA